MKQRITAEQLNELSPEQKERLHYCLRPKEFKFLSKVPLVASEITTGQIIELLGERLIFIESVSVDEYNWRVISTVLWAMAREDEDAVSFTESYSEELCDALWQALKGVL